MSESKAEKINIFYFLVSSKENQSPLVARYNLGKNWNLTMIFQLFS